MTPVLQPQLEVLEPEPERSLSRARAVLEDRTGAALSLRAAIISGSSGTAAAAAPAAGATVQLGTLVFDPWSAASV